MSQSLFLLAETEIDQSTALAWGLASLYGKSLYEVQFEHWFVLRVANALINTK